MFVDLVFCKAFQLHFPILSQRQNSPPVQIVRQIWWCLMIKVFYRIDFIGISIKCASTFLLPVNLGIFKFHPTFKNVTDLLVIGYNLIFSTAMVILLFSLVLSHKRAFTLPQSCLLFVSFLKLIAMILCLLS